MKPAAFEYRSPTTVAETVSLLSEHATDAVVLAGGQSLVPALNFRLGAPSVLIDLNRVEGLATVGAEGSAVRIGALTRQSAVIADASLRRHCPALALAARHIGHVPIRNRGTVGGSVAHADPAAEIPAVLALADATVELTSVRGTRSLPAAEFFLGPYFTAKEPDELVTAVTVPSVAADRWGFHEIARRPGDFALAGAVASLETDGLRVAAARVALLGVEPSARRLRSVEDAMIGVDVADAAAVASAATGAAELDVLDDPKVPVGYRAHLATVAVRRAVDQAAAS